MTQNNFSRLKASLQWFWISLCPPKYFPHKRGFYRVLMETIGVGVSSLYLVGNFCLQPHWRGTFRRKKIADQTEHFCCIIGPPSPPSLPPPFPPPQIASTIQVTYEHDVRSSNTNKICLIFTIIFRWTNQKKLFQSEIDKFLADFSQKILTFIEFGLFSGKILTFNQNCFWDC